MNLELSDPKDGPPGGCPAMQHSGNDQVLARILPVGEQQNRACPRRAGVRHAFEARNLANRSGTPLEAGLREL